MFKFENSKIELLNLHDFKEFPNKENLSTQIQIHFVSPEGEQDTLPQNMLLWHKNDFEPSHFRIKILICLKAETLKRTQTTPPLINPLPPGKVLVFSCRQELGTTPR